MRSPDAENQKDHESGLPTAAYGDGWIGTLHPSVECAYCGVGFVASTKESLDSLLANHRKVCREPKK